jgi:hypothetical protein
VNPTPYGLSPHTPGRCAKRKPAPWGGGGGRFARPSWFDEPPPEQMAAPRSGLSASGIRNAARGRGEGSRLC